MLNSSQIDGLVLEAKSNLIATSYHSSEEFFTVQRCNSGSRSSCLSLPLLSFDSSKNTPRSHSNIAPFKVIMYSTNFFAFVLLLRGTMSRISIAMLIKNGTATSYLSYSIVICFLVGWFLLCGL